jgi:hypothetical protein
MSNNPTKAASLRLLRLRVINQILIFITAGTTKAA